MTRPRIVSDGEHPAYASPHERYEAEARAWDEAGRPELDASRWRTAAFHLWMQSEGAKREAVSARVRDYLAALRASLDAESPGWYDGMFDDRDVCAVCGERYRMENLALCTECSALYCYRDRASGGTAPNGNDRCPRCGVGEIVG
jgi:hypothetical protein